MKAILINPESRSIEMADINSHEDIIKMIGFDSIESDEIGKDGDRLYFDEDCFLRGSSGRFQLDSLAPVAGKAVVARLAQDGTKIIDVTTELDSLRSRVKYL